MKHFLALYLSIAMHLLINTSLNAQGTCITTSTIASDGAFSVGFKVTYETAANGVDVDVTFELLDADKTLNQAFLFNDPALGFSETAMTIVTSKIATLTLNAQIPGETISKACKFIFNEGGATVSQYVQYEVNTDCAGTNDVTSPDGFTATVGAITAFSVELLLNSNDASGTVMYDVVYGANSKRISAPSGAQKSFIIAPLASSTAYTFNVSAIDLAGNIAANNPIPLAASTIADTSTACEGTSADTSEGSFQVGYNYAFETQANGTDVKFTFELLDDRPYGLAFLHREAPDFLETGPLTEDSPKVWSITLAQTPGATISYAFKIEFSPGLAVTKYFSYEVGDNCALGTEDFELTSFNSFPNPAGDSWTVKSNNINISSIHVFDILGKNVLSLTPNKREVKIDVTGLHSGLYFAKINTESGTKNVKFIKN